MTSAAATRTSRSGWKFFGRRAARRRGVTPSAVVRQIDALENGLGVRVLVRSTRALAMTDAGQRLFERGQRLIDDLVDVHAEVAAFPTFGKRYVLPVAGALMREHPRLLGELDLTEPEPSAKLRTFIDALRKAVGPPPVWQP